jgi:ABC-type transport system involved in cytochrome c biogenesis ATPase subunit
MEQIYRQRLNHFEELAKSHDRRSAALANGRLALFLISAGTAIATVFHRLPTWGWAIAGIGLVAFLALASWHSRVIDAERRANVEAELNRRGLSRLSGQWHSFTSHGEKYGSPDHLYTPDLDVFGQGSLFQRLNETATLKGEALLASWLCEKASPVAEIVSRQKAAHELSGLIDFRQALLTESRVASDRPADPSRFIQWAEGPNLLQPVSWARPFRWILPPITLALGFLAQYEVLPVWPAFASFVTQLAVAAATGATCSKFYAAVTDGQGGFVRHERTFATVAAQAFRHDRLKALRERAGASEKLGRFGRLFAFAELRSSGQYHAIINVLFLWDLHWLFQLEAWRTREGKDVRQWFDALAELEALSALGTWTQEHERDCFPTMTEESGVFEAKGLGHPLLMKPVVNDVVLSHQTWVITGSNMSGKTTLLRAMGLNTVMALAGLPVCASAMRVSQLQVLTSMRVKDSLERGVSYFYAEVQRIKAVLDAAQAQKANSLFLLDELLMGTNTQERQVASRRLLEILQQSGAIGALTTHDLFLTATANVRNVHFRDLVTDGAMSFDYQLHEGVVETTNALRLLRSAGVPI